MVAIAVVSSMLASIENIWFGVLWIFLWGPLCGIWLSGRKGARMGMILGGGAGGAVVGFFFAFTVCVYEYFRTDHLVIWFALFLASFAGIWGMVLGVCAWLLSLNPGWRPKKPISPDMIGPIDVAKWRDFCQASDCARYDKSDS
jgi:hypothetical protein